MFLLELVLVDDRDVGVEHAVSQTEAVDLDRDVLDPLLDGLVNIGFLTLAWENGIPIYRAGIFGGY